MQYKQYIPIIKALSDETRLKIVDMLSCGELCACKILEAFNITQPTLSRIERGQSQPDFFTMTELERAFDLQAGKLAQQTEEAVEEARRAAEPGVRARGEGAGTPWWGIALGVAGFAGLVAFAVATLLDGDDEELD